MQRLLLAALAALGLTAGAARAANPVVVVDTSLGSFKVELFEKEAPQTVKNFLNYVDNKFYDGTLFHRVMPGFMIQGGGMDPNMREKSGNPPIKNEASNGLSNKRGTIAMARTDEPNSATAQFYINVADNTFLDKSGDSDGYAVFGKVTEGMDIVDKIKSVETTGDRGRPHANAPVKDVVIKSIRVEKK